MAAGERARDFNVVPVATDARVQSGGRRVFKLHEVDSLAAGFDTFVGYAPMELGEQQSVMRAFWARLGLQMPDFPPKVFRELDGDEARESRKKHTGRMAPFPVYEDSKQFETMMIQAITPQTFPRHRFGGNNQPVRLLDNDYGLFPRFMADPEAIINNEDTQYMLRFTAPDGSLVSRSEYIEQFVRNGQAVRQGDATWLYALRHTPGNAPLEQAIVWHLLYQASGTPVSADHLLISNEAIYAADARRNDDRQSRPQLHRLIGVQWRADRMVRGQIRVADWDPVTGTRPQPPFAPAIGRAALEQSAS